MARSGRSTGSPSTPKMIRGADAFVQALAAEGVKIIFGYPGGAILPFFDAVYDDPIQFVLTRHEQGAGHAADGYARATGEVGVCVATSGPGATNLVTALATAHLDSIPMVAFTGQVPTSVIGNDAFQEADVTGVTRPVTKHNVLIRDVRDLPRIVKEAFHIARTGRPGPVLIDLPKDVQVLGIEAGTTAEMDLPGYRPRRLGHSRQIKLAAERINKAERPVLYVGGGVVLAGACDALRKLARQGNIPVTTTLLALGAFDEVGDADLALHMLGMHGSVHANLAVQNCDLLIAVGARFDDRVTGNLDSFAPHAKIVHIDVDPSSISKNVEVDVPVVGDAKLILEEMLALVERRERKVWFDQIGGWRKSHPFSYDRAAATLKPQYVVEEICKQTDASAVITTGVGQHQMWAAQYYRWRHPRQMITSGGLGTMGFGLPSAIGAQMGRPGETVIDIDGDASFMMTMTEVATAMEQNLPIKVVILNNMFQGMVRQWQELFFDRRYSGTKMNNPNFKLLAESFGATGMVVKDKAEVPDAVAQMLKTDGCVLADFHVEVEENVYPMVTVGKSLHEMELGGMA